MSGSHIQCCIKLGDIHISKPFRGLCRALYDTKLDRVRVVIDNKIMGESRKC